MALDNDPVFVQEPQTAGIDFGAASQSTVMDPSTVAPTVLLTAGADGSLVTSIELSGQDTVIDEKFVLWIQPGGSGDWFFLKDVKMDAYTMAAGTVQGKTTLVDKLDLQDRIRLSALDKLGITHHIDQQSMAAAEYSDF